MQSTPLWDPMPASPYDAEFGLSFGRIRNPRVLIVEDDKDLWPILDRVGWLVDSDLVIDFAEDANSALTHLLDDERYDAVLADVQLPNRHTSVWVLEKSQRLQPWADVALMSAHPCDVDIAFLSKPFSIRQCRSFLTDLLL
jgi:DNA-binding NtrC family response regulator